MANTVNLVTTFLPLVDEKFTTESRKSLLTNNDFDWTGAHSIKVYKVSTSAMNDYDRPGTNAAKNWSRFGPVAGLDATTGGGLFFCLLLRSVLSKTFILSGIYLIEQIEQMLYYLNLKSKKNI